MSTAAVRPSMAWWGMALVVATEGVLFLVLISSYFYLRWENLGAWPPEGFPDPAWLRPTLLTAALVLSAAPMALAQRGVRRGSRVALNAGLLGTLALAGVYLGLQIWDLAAKTSEFVPQDHAYASLVYLLPGAHAVHVTFGMLGVAWIAVRALRGRYGPDNHAAVAVWSLYWYFLAAVAVGVWLTVIVSPYL